LSDEAVRTDGQVCPQKVESLERLARLAEIAGAAQRAPRKRWPALAALGITLATVSILLFARVPHTDIETELILSAVSFGIPAPQVLLDGTSTASLGASGLREIQLPPILDRPSRTLRGPAGSESAIRLSVASSGIRRGAITLDPFAVAAGTHAWLRTMEVPNQVRLSLKGEGLTFRANLSGPVRIGLSGEPPEQVDFPAPAPVLLRAGTNEIDLDIEFSSVPFALRSPLFVDSLSLFQTEQFVEERRTIVRNTSTILAGTLYFESLGGRAKTLRAGEGIRFEEARGEIRTLRWKDNHLALGYHGTVSGMNTGSGEHTNSLMPTCLEWLQARHGLSLLWAASVYFFGLIFGALRWWGYDV
jgi:hypothetical protein